MTTHQNDIEKAKPSNEPGTGGPGLGGTQEGIEQSGPPSGMSGGDTSLHSDPLGRQPERSEADEDTAS